MSLLSKFDKVWLIDFEFIADEGERPSVVCMVAREWKTGKRIELWADELRNLDQAPFDTGPDAICMAYYSSSEMGCFIALDWPLPAHVVDLYAEFRNQTNGVDLPCGKSLLGALVAYGLDAMEAVEKTCIRERILRGFPFTTDERIQILKDCGEDVDALARLLNVLEPRLSGHSVLRGRYTKAVARMEWNGVPIDTDYKNRLDEHWSRIQGALIKEVDVPFGVFDGKTFKMDRFAKLLRDRRISWPLLDSGDVELQDATFKQMCRLHPELTPLRELRRGLSQMRENELSIGHDGRNRCLLSPYSSKSGRNQPSTSRFIFGLASWLRGLIRPEPGMALAYIDWSQQEFGIAAALSGDRNMQQAYLSGDPYLEFAKLAGLLPPDATKKSHRQEREIFKVVVLAVQYSMAAQSLAGRLGVSESEARHLLDLHRRTFPVYWEWSDSAYNFAALTCRLHTVLGWQITVTPKTNYRTLLNFPMQSNGSEIMRLACSLATERGIKVCCPIHDALLIEAPLGQIDQEVQNTQAIMRNAGETVLAGFPLNSEAKIIRHPDRYDDPRGTTMWSTVLRLLNSERTPSSPATPPLSRAAPLPVHL